MCREVKALKTWQDYICATRLQRFPEILPALELEVNQNITFPAAININSPSYYCSSLYRLTNYPEDECGP